MNDEAISFIKPQTRLLQSLCSFAMTEFRNDGILKFPEAKRSQKAQEAQKG